MIVTHYKRPDGRTEELDIQNVIPEDEEYFIRNNISISIEDIGEMFVLYADIGMIDEYGVPIELMYFSQNKTCEETLSALRKLCEDELK